MCTKHINKLKFNVPMGNWIVTQLNIFSKGGDWTGPTWMGNYLTLVTHRQSSWSSDRLWRGNTIGWLWYVHYRYIGEWCRQAHYIIPDPHNNHHRVWLMSVNREVNFVWFGNNEHKMDHPNIINNIFFIQSQKIKTLPSTPRQKHLSRYLDCRYVRSSSCWLAFALLHSYIYICSIILIHRRLIHAISSLTHFLYRSHLDAGKQLQLVSFTYHHLLVFEMIVHIYTFAIAIPECMSNVHVRTYGSPNGTYCNRVPRITSAHIKSNNELIWLELHHQTGRLAPNLYCTFIRDCMVNYGQHCGNVHTCWTYTHTHW